MPPPKSEPPHISPLTSDSARTPSHGHPGTDNVAIAEYDAFKHAMAANAAWAAYKVHQNPTFFSDLADHQSPKIRTLFSPRVVLHQMY
jgi:hypothetical protein